MNRRAFLVTALVALVGFFSGCSHAPTASAAKTPPPLLLISLDGFRWDYCDLYPDETVHLRRLRREGCSSEGLIPVYPSNTFPNHYTIVTGLYPAHHGIVNNDFFDPQFGEFFHYNRPAIAREGKWWGGEPIWLTALRQGRRSACSFWPGSDAPIQGRYPTHWKPYDYSIPFEKRLAELMSWLDVPPAERPAVTTFYLEETNSTGHRRGPRSPEMRAAVKLIDTRVGAIVDRFAAAHLDVNIVIVSDHGMAEASPDRVVIFEDYFDPTLVQVDFAESCAGLRAPPGLSVDELFAAVSRMPHMSVYRANDLPARFHLRDNPRVPDIWIVPDEGWMVMSRARFANFRPHFDRGQHGYDPALTSMRATLIAWGPSFKQGVRIPPVENIHVYNLLCAATGLRPAPNDGDDRLVRAFLR